MKIVLSGAHCTGKTTLVEALSHSLKEFEAVDEPWYLLEAEGYEFSDFPVIEDFEGQLGYSVNMILESAENTIFDRCPLDFLAYIHVLNSASPFDTNHWNECIGEAMEQIDLVVFVPIEIPDLIICHPENYPELRENVNREIQDLIYEFRFSSDLEILEVSGSIENRKDQILTCLQLNRTAFGNH